MPEPTMSDMVYVNGLGHVPWWRIGPAIAGRLSKKTVEVYARARDLSVESHFCIDAPSKFVVNIGAGTGRSYRAALVDLLEWERRTGVGHVLARRKEKKGVTHA